jgi:hypothetical protein
MPFLLLRNFVRTPVFQLRQVRKRLFSMECEGLRAQFLKCFHGEHTLEQEGLPTRGCPLYIAGQMI